MAALLLILVLGVVLWAVIRSRTPEGDDSQARRPRRPVRQQRVPRPAPDDDPEFLASLRDLNRGRDAED